MDYYLISFLLGALISLFLCKNFYFFRKNQNAHIFSKMFGQAFNDIRHYHSDKHGTELQEAIDKELAPCIDFLKKHRAFLPKGLKKWFQKAMKDSPRGFDYLNQFLIMKIHDDSMHANLSCQGEKSYQYISLRELLTSLLIVHCRYTWQKRIFYIDSS